MSVKNSYNMMQSDRNGLNINKIHILLINQSAYLNVENSCLSVLVSCERYCSCSNYLYKQRCISCTRCKKVSYFQTVSLRFHHTVLLDCIIYPKDEPFSASTLLLISEVSISNCSKLIASYCMFRLKIGKNNCQQTQMPQNTHILKYQEINSKFRSGCQLKRL